MGIHSQNNGKQELRANLVDLAEFFEFAFEYKLKKLIQGLLEKAPIADRKTCLLKMYNAGRLDESMRLTIQLFTGF